MSYDNLLLEVRDRIAFLTVNRPKALNALNRATLLELDRALDEVERNADVGVVVLAGAGDRAFVAGADIREMAAMGAVEAEAFSRLGQGVLTRLECLGRPVIAAVNGFALGGGCELALAATLRLAAESAEFGQPEVDLGLIPGFAGTQRLVRLVGPSRALDLVLTGRRVKAAEALAMGLVHRVVPAADLAAEAESLARTLLGKAPRALASAMAAIRTGVDCGFDAGSRLEASLFGLLFATADMKEGTQAFLEKRKPRFEGR